MDPHGPIPKNAARAACPGFITFGGPQPHGHSAEDGTQNHEFAHPVWTRSARCGVL